MGRGRDRIPACDGSRIVERQEHEALLGKLGVWSGKDGDVLFAGTGVAMLAATVAKRIHAPTRTSPSRPAASGRCPRSCRWPSPTRA